MPKARLLWVLSFTAIHRRLISSGQQGMLNFSVASFSSIGGNNINGEDRRKPDIVAPNGVNTTVQPGGLDVDLDVVPQGKDGFFNFFRDLGSSTSCRGPCRAFAAHQGKIL
jgi:hypothetical protein